MVKLSEVTDEHYEEVQPGPIPSDNDDDFDEDYSDTDSEADSSHPHHHHPQQHPSSAFSRKPTSAKISSRFVDDDDDEEEESDSEDEEDGLTLEESLWERLVALKDMIPIKQRTGMSNLVKGVWGWVSWGVRGGGQVAFVVSTGMLMVGVPYALAVAEEGQMLEMEREMKVCRILCLWLGYWWMRESGGGREEGERGRRGSGIWEGLNVDLEAIDFFSEDERRGLTRQYYSCNNKQMN